MLPIIFVAPVFQLFMFGYAVSTDVNHIATAVFDEDRTPASRDLIARFERSGYFDFTRYLQKPAEVNTAMDRSQAQFVLHIPRGFSEDLRRNRVPVVQSILDGTDAATARIIYGYANGVLQSYTREVVLERLDRNRGLFVRVPTIAPEVRVWFNPELRSVKFMVPGVLCLILLVITMMMTSLAIVKEKEIGTLEQLIVTPISSLELMLGKTLPFLLIGLMDMTLMLLVAVYWFHVYVAGSLLLLFGLSALFLLTTLGLGIFISTISQTQHEATLTSFFFMLPFILLSGFMFPIQNMPVVIQAVTYLIPLRYFLEIIRGIFLKGIGLEVLWPQALVLALFGVTIITISALRFRKRIG